MSSHTDASASPSIGSPVEVRVSAVPEQVPFTARIADPGPLGLAAFAMTTFVLSSFNAGLLPGTVEPVVFGLALFYGGAVQVLAGLVEYTKGNTFGATAFCSYGAFWMSLWYINTHTTWGDGATASDKAHAVGLYLLAWTIFTLYMFITSFKTSGALVVVFAVLTVTFICLTIGHLAEADGFDKLGGWLGLITAFAAWYTSFAAVMNATAGRPILPVVPMKK
jgi:hypothetical protein